MLKAKHNCHQYAPSHYGSAVQSAPELVTNAYKKINGWYQDDPMLGFTPEDILEIIDRFRIPLASKKFDGLSLSTQEINYLNILEDLTDKILNTMTPMPQEPSELKSAMLHAKRILKKS